MPSPSKIPVFSKFPHQKRAKNIAINNDTAGIRCETNPKKSEKHSKNSKEIKPAGISSCSNAQSSTCFGKTVETRSRQKNVGDRRGISEIKRSEQNLLVQIEHLEKDVKELKLQIDEMEITARKQDSAYDSLQEIADKLKENNDNLGKENNELHELMERKEINPVTKNPMPTTESFKILLKLRHEESSAQAKQLLPSIKSLDEKFGDARRRLETVNLAD